MVNMDAEKKAAKEQQVKLVLDYFVDQVAAGDDRPPEVVGALLDYRWPDRDFKCRKEIGLYDTDLFTFVDFIDLETGMTADQLYKSEKATREEK